MKKYITLTILSLLLITGCGNTQKLECNIYNDYNDIKTNREVKATFKGEQLEKISIKMDVQLSEKNIEYMDDLIEGAKKQFEQYKDYNVSKRNDGFTFKLNVNFKQADETSKENFGFINAYNNYDQIKQELENDGYTCK